MSDEHKAEARPHSSGGHGRGHGGGSHEEHEGAPEWLISFADNVTLMMGFFVILLAMNMKPATAGAGNGGEGTGEHIPATPDTLDLAIAIREAFNNPVDPNSSNPVDLPLIRRLIERSGESPSLRRGPIGREHDVKSLRSTTYYGTAGSIPFARGKSQLNEEGRESLKQLMKQIRGYRLVFEIRGHVSTAESFDLPDRGMRLSFERALAVADAMCEDEAMSRRQLRIVACADTDRLVGVVYDENGHAANQRVEIVVTEEMPAGSNETTPEGTKPVSGSGH